MTACQPPLKGLAGVAVLDGVQLLNAKLRTAHRAGGVSGGTQNTIRNAPRRIRTGPLGFPRGEAGRLDGSSEPARLTEEGWRQPKYCLHFVQWYQPKIIADSFTTWRRAFIKPGRNPTHRTLHETFGARHPSSVTPRWGAPASPRGKPRGLVRIRLGAFRLVFCVPRLTPPARCAASALH